MKNILRISIVSLLIIGILTFIACLLPSTKLLWTAYSWDVLSIIVFSAVLGYFALSVGKNYLMRATFPLYLWLFPIIIFLVSVFFVFCQAVKWFSAPIWSLCLINLIITTIFVTVFLLLNSYRELVQSQDNSPVQQKYKSWKLYAVNADGIAAKADAADRALLTKVAEAIRYSDPVTPQELLRLDEEIFTQLSALENAVNQHKSEEVKQIANELLAKITNRSEKVKIFK